MDRGIHKIGCQYWRDMDNGSPSITCTCGLWAAEWQETEANLQAEREALPDATRSPTKGDEAK